MAIRVCYLHAWLLCYLFMGSYEYACVSSNSQDADKPLYVREKTHKKKKELVYWVFLDFFSHFDIHSAVAVLHSSDVQIPL